MEVTWAAPQTPDVTIDEKRKILRLHAPFGQRLGRPHRIRIGLAQDKGRRCVVLALAAESEDDGVYDVNYSREGSSTGQISIGRAFNDLGLDTSEGRVIKKNAHADEVGGVKVWLVWLD